MRKYGFYYDIKISVDERIQNWSGHTLLNCKNNNSLPQFHVRLSSCHPLILRGVNIVSLTHWSGCSQISSTTRVHKFIAHIQIVGIVAFSVDGLVRYLICCKIENGDQIVSSGIEYNKLVEGFIVISSRNLLVPYYFSRPFCYLPQWIMTLLIQVLCDDAWWRHQKMLMTSQSGKRVRSASPSGSAGGRRKP